MKKLFYLLSFLLFINNYQSNKNDSCGNIRHILKNKDINPEYVTQEKQNQLAKLLKKNKNEKFSKELEKLLDRKTKIQNRK